MSLRITVVSSETSETKTEILRLSLNMSLRIFVNPGPGVTSFQ